MEQEKFVELVSRSIDALPAEFLDALDNVDVVVEDSPTPEQLKKTKTGDEVGLLLGLYEGVPRTRRTTGYNMVLPDKITLFRTSIEKICRNDEEIFLQIQKTLKHEVAHHFGISDARLEEFEEKKS